MLWNLIGNFLLRELDPKTKTTKFRFIPVLQISMIGIIPVIDFFIWFKPIFIHSLFENPHIIDLIENGKNRLFEIRILLILSGVMTKSLIWGFQKYGCGIMLLLLCFYVKFFNFSNGFLQLPLRTLKLENNILFASFLEKLWVLFYFIWFLFISVLDIDVDNVIKFLLETLPQFRLFDITVKEISSLLSIRTRSAFTETFWIVDENVRWLTPHQAIFPHKTCDLLTLELHHTISLEV